MHKIIHAVHSSVFSAIESANSWLKIQCVEMRSVIHGLLVAEQDADSSLF